MSKFTSPFLAKSPLKEKQSIQSTFKELKAKVGGKIRRIFGEPDPTIKDPKDYNHPVEKLNKTRKGK